MLYCVALHCISVCLNQMFPHIQIHNKKKSKKKVGRTLPHSSHAVREHCFFIFIFVLIFVLFFNFKLQFCPCPSSLSLPFTHKICELKICKCPAARYSTLQHTATHCNTLPYTATLTHSHSAASHCDTLQHTATHYNTLQHSHTCTLPHRTVTHYNTLQHSTHSHFATHRNTLQHTATHCSTLQHIATHCNTLQHTATHCNTLQHSNVGPQDDGIAFVSPPFSALRLHILITECKTHTATHCNTLQHTATHCNTLRHTAILKCALNTFFLIFPLSQYCVYIPITETCSTHCDTLQHTTLKCALNIFCSV